jgi:hypothetical protein
MGAAVPDASTARAMALAVITSRQKPDVSKRYVLEVEPDGSKGWIAFQYVSTVTQKNGDLLVSAGGGGLRMNIDRCSGAISELYHQR